MMAIGEFFDLHWPDGRHVRYNVELAKELCTSPGRSTIDLDERDTFLLIRNNEINEAKLKLVDVDRPGVCVLQPIYHGATAHEITIIDGVHRACRALCDRRFPFRVFILTEDERQACIVFEENMDRIIDQPPPDPSLLPKPDLQAAVDDILDAAERLERGAK